MSPSTPTVFLWGSPIPSALPTPSSDVFHEPHPQVQSISFLISYVFCHLSIPLTFIQVTTYTLVPDNEFELVLLSIILKVPVMPLRLQRGIRHSISPQSLSLVLQTHDKE